MKAYDWNKMKKAKEDNNSGQRSDDDILLDTQQPELIEVITPKDKMEEFVEIHGKEGTLIAKKVKSELNLEDEDLQTYLKSIETRQAKSKTDFVDKVPFVSQTMFTNNKDSLSKSQNIISKVMENPGLQNKTCQQLFEKEQLQSAKSQPEAIVLSATVKQQMNQTVTLLQQSNQTPPDDKLKPLQKSVLPFIPKYLMWQILEITNECVAEIENSLNAQYSNMMSAFNEEFEFDLYVSQMDNIKKQIVKDEVKFMENMLSDFCPAVRQQVTQHLNKISTDIKHEYEIQLDRKYKH